MGDCLQTAKPSQYITNIKVSSVLYSYYYLIGMSSIGLLGLGWGWARSSVSGSSWHYVITYGRWRSVALWWVFC